MAPKNASARDLPEGTIRIKFPLEEARVYIPRLKKWGIYCSETGAEEGIAILPRGVNGEYNHSCDPYYGRWYLLSNKKVFEVTCVHSAPVLGALE